MKLDGMDIVVLCGGLGTRLRTVVSDRPKSMADFCGRPFLDILLDYFKGFGFRRIILCVGYRAEAIKSHYANRFSDMEILFSEEKAPLGTGGAIKNAEHLIKSNPFCVANGDSFCSIQMDQFLSFHSDKKATISIAVSSVGKTKDYGAVCLDHDSQVLSFDEKKESQEKAAVNAGVYIFEKKILFEMHKGDIFSLEKDLFTRVCGKGLYGFFVDSPVIDIGTPERYAYASNHLK